MKSFFKYKRITAKGLAIKYIVVAALCLVASALLIAGRTSRAFADFFCGKIYPAVSGVFSRISGIFPFSLGEMLIILAMIAFLVGITLLIIYTVKRKGQRIRAFLKGAFPFALAAAIIFLIMTTNCLIGYNRTPFSSFSGLELREYTSDELKALIEELTENVNEYAEKVSLDENGRAIKPDNFSETATAAMKALGEKYEVLNVSYPQPKAVICSEFMSSLNIAGIYLPFTVEANYNQSMPVSAQGFTVCHELSHLSGFMREDEANFIAFLACRESADDYFCYSGYISALSYALNAFYSDANKEEYYELYAKISDTVKNEYKFRSEYWAQYEKKTSYQVSSAVNDAYLKSNDQTDGTKSYGRVVDLLIAEREARMSGEN